MPVIYPIQRAPEEMIVMSIVSSDYVLGQQFTELIRRLYKSYNLSFILTFCIEMKEFIWY
jgi:hypothetical protein